MKRIIVIGCPGSGKSTFSIKLAVITNLPLVHLDQLNWNADRTIVDSAVFLERQAQAIRQPSWIIDGNYGSSMEFRLKACDTIIFLDYPLEVCLEGIASRVGTVRPDMPWVETELDEEFLAFIRNFSHTSRPNILSLLSQYPDKEQYIFHSREEAAQFLEKMKKP
ncbi:adenylate kinase family enzyme [Streptococcus gallinaceus]|uniref:adenylate kinase n=1 Tax=Streptococcus gallinaceus TaxID=165758 RepID=UPI0020A19850|nr:adenylate kinase [Streptococcus gallinaceus]MCP1639186.1 adenylate kinase family enzyme [Streptococcus gallinaceus]MCP1770171.1 adenylate kinase family enzyme [Streptococcus gallinaceus]